MATFDLSSLLPHNLHTSSSPSFPAPFIPLPHHLYHTPSSSSSPAPPTTASQSTTRDLGKFLDLPAVQDAIQDFKASIGVHLVERLHSLLSGEEKPTPPSEEADSADLLISLLESEADPFLEGTVVKAREALAAWEEAAVKMAQVQELMLQALDDVSESIR